MGMTKRARSGHVGATLAGFLMAALCLAGCHSPTKDGDDGDQPVAPPDIIREADLLTISFSDTAQFPTSEQRVKADGTITLPFNQSFVAAGKTRGELEAEIRERYVPTWVRNLTVNIKAQERVYYVGGEVKAPGRQPYLGKLTVLRAIQSCGDFTDFADKKHVKLIRASGRIRIVNCVKALNDAKLDLEVYPDDNVIVPRSVLQ